MTYRGRVEGGIVMFVGSEKPADGTLVTIEAVNSSIPESSVAEPSTRRLLKWAGKIEGLPPDASLNLDHYLYGHPKK